MAAPSFKFHYQTPNGWTSYEEFSRKPETWREIYDYFERRGDQAYIMIDGEIVDRDAPVVIPKDRNPVLGFYPRQTLVKPARGEMSDEEIERHLASGMSPKAVAQLMFAEKE